MKIVCLILLLITSVIIPETAIIYPAFIGFCFPTKFKDGIKSYINILLNIFLAYLILTLDICFLGSDILSKSKLIYLLKKFELVDFYMFFFLSFFQLLLFKFIYKLKITTLDILIHFFGLLGINYLSEPLGTLLIKRDHFRTFEMSLILIFIFYSVYSIWKVDNSESEKIIEQ
nr:hypothetical protein [uncultured Flavobacterium sp.]